MESELNVLTLLEMGWFSSSNSSTARKRSGNTRARESPRLADRLSLEEDSKGIIWRKGRADAVAHNSFIFEPDGALETPRLMHGDRNAPTISDDSGEGTVDTVDNDACYSSTAVSVHRSDGSSDIEDDGCYPCEVNQSNSLPDPSGGQRVCVYGLRLLFRTYFSVLLGVHVLFDVIHVLRMGQHG